MNPRNPVALAKLPKTLTKETGKRAFTLAEVRQLHDKADAFWQWMIRTAFFTGFASGDLVALRRINVDPRQRTISIKRRQTGKPVPVPISDALLEMFKSRWPAKPEDFFFPEQASRYLTTGASSFSQEFFDLMAACGLVEPRPTGAKIGTGKGRDARRAATCGFHCLRHTFVTNLKLTGAMDSMAKELAGRDPAHPGICRANKNTNTRFKMKKSKQQASNPTPPVTPPAGWDDDDLEVGLILWTPRMRRQDGKIQYALR